MDSRPQFTLHRVTARKLPRPSFADALLKFSLVLFIALIFTLADAFSASGVSPKFDGLYEGAMTPATTSNPQACPAVRIDEFVVHNGLIRPPAKVSDTAPVVFEGFVTEEGFVSGHVTLAGRRGPFEGRMVQEANGTLLSAGITDGEGACAYLLELHKAR